MSRLVGDHGTGLIGTMSGVLAFLLLMFVAVQVLTNLYATSVVTSAAHEGARVAAGRGVDQSDRASVTQARARGERRVRQLLGRFGARVEVDWSDSDSDRVVLHVRAESPRLLPGPLGVHPVDRTVHARVEQLR